MAVDEQEHQWSFTGDTDLLAQPDGKLKGTYENAQATSVERYEWELSPWIHNSDGFARSRFFSIFPLRPRLRIGLAPYWFIPGPIFPVFRNSGCHVIRGADFPACEQISLDT